MPKGISLHIGVNRIDYGRYAPTAPNALTGCDGDARAMAALAAEGQFSSITVLIDEAATFNAVEDCIHAATDALESGDIFLLSFSGHGIKSPSFDGPGIEPDKIDEGWVLYDLVMKDNYIDAFLRTFKPGVRIVVVSDSCGSGSVFASPRLHSTRHTFASGGDAWFSTAGYPRNIPHRPEIPPFIRAGMAERGEYFRHSVQESYSLSGTFRHTSQGSWNLPLGFPPIMHRSRELPTEVSIYHYRQRRREYARLDRRFRMQTEWSASISQASPMAYYASAIILSASMDNELAFEVGTNGVFTKAIVDAVHARRSDKSPTYTTYQTLFEAVRNQVQSQRPGQHPQFSMLGDEHAFAANFPFTI